MNKVIDGYSPVESTTTRAIGAGVEHNWDEIYRYGGYQTGWVCPICGRVNAPWMPCCSCGGKADVRLSYSSTGTDYDLDREKYLKKYQKELDEIIELLNEKD